MWVMLGADCHMSSYNWLYKLLDGVEVDVRADVCV